MTHHAGRSVLRSIHRASLDLEMAVSRGIDRVAAAARLPLAPRRARRLIGQGLTKVHCGCGNMAIPGWINIDIAPPTRRLFKRSSDAPLRPNLLADLSKGLPFPDGVATHVYSNNFLEHLKPLDGKRYLQEAMRILVPGGAIRTVVPDVAQFVEAVMRQDIAFLRSHTEDNSHWPDWVQTPMEYLNTIIQGSEEFGWPHEWGFDEQTLTLYLSSAGFTDIRRFPADESDDPEFREVGGVPPVCLTLEAKKPGH